MSNHSAGSKQTHSQNMSGNDDPTRFSTVCASHPVRITRLGSLRNKVAPSMSPTPCDHDHRRRSRCGDRAETASPGRGRFRRAPSAGLRLPQFMPRQVVLSALAPGRLEPFGPPLAPVEAVLARWEVPDLAVRLIPEIVSAWNLSWRKPGRAPIGGAGGCRFGSAPTGAPTPRAFPALLAHLTYGGMRVCAWLPHPQRRIRDSNPCYRRERPAS